MTVSFLERENVKLKNQNKFLILAVASAFILNLIVILFIVD